MKNVKAILIPNTEAEWNLNNVWDVQGEMKRPVLLITNDKDELLDHYWLEAESMKELKLMYEEKTFFTSSITEGSHLKAFGATFLGVPKDYYKEKDAQLQLNARENIA